MTVSAWSTEAWADTNQNIGSGVTDLSKLFWAPSFNGHTDGEAATGKTDGGFWEGGVIDNTVTLDGQSSLRCDIKEGDVGSDQGEGHYIGIGKGIGSVTADENGSEIWMRWFTRQQAGFSWDHGTGGNVSGALKMMRFTPKTVSGGGTRKVEVQRVNTDNAIQGTVDGSWVGYHEAIFADGDDRNWWIFDETNANDLEDEKWEQWEAHCVGSRDWDVGEWRFWRNGKRVGKVVKQATWQATLDAGYWENVMFITYWNAGCPKDQTLWYCRPAVAVRCSGRDDTPHMDRDENNFPIIGMAT